MKHERQGVIRDLIDRMSEALGKGVPQFGKAAGNTPRNIFQYYEDRFPTHQNAIDAIPGWSTAFPPHLDLKAGTLATCCDARIAWAIECFGPLEGRRVLELGPLEAGHTVQLEEAGASVEAIEANRLAYFRCLVVKEVMGLTRARFHLGDFVKWLEKGDTTYDLVVASGVLYHMTDPLRFLRLLARASDSLYLWTHYVDDDAMPQGDPRRGAFGKSVRIEEFDGLEVRLYPRSYFHAEWSPQFNGGMVDEHFWIHKKDILAVLNVLGYTTLMIAHDEPDHKNGPSFSIFARRPSAAVPEAAPDASAAVPEP